MVYKVLYCVGNLYIPFRRELELLQEGKVAKALTYELWVQFLVTGSHIFSFLCFIYNLTSNNPYYVNVIAEWACVCLQGPGLHCSITARQRLRKENVVDCCVKFTILIKTVWIMLSLTVYLVSNYKTKLKVCCLLFWVNLAHKNHWHS